VADLLVEGATVVVAGHEREIVRRAGLDARPIIRLAGCTDRHTAEGLAGEEMLIARDHAPELEPDEWWADDLQGCAVRDGEVEVGTVTRLLGLPSCEVLEVNRGEEQRELLVPLVKDAVRSVDVQARVIDVDLRFLGEA
jgi:16S rRNA processing protein RimM